MKNLDKQFGAEKIWNELRCLIFFINVKKQQGGNKWQELG